MKTLDDALRPGVVSIDGVEVDVVDVDRLGVTVRRVSVTGPPCDLRERVDQLSRAENLPANVRPIEVDPGLGGAVLRSVPRRKVYFEVRTDGRTTTVEKVHIGADGREKVPYTLTREQLGRMVEELE
jgi:hypothetical protein